MRKGRIKSPWVSLKCLIRIQFLWRKDHIYTRHFSKHTNKLSQLQNKKNLNLLTITFLAIYFINRGKASYMNPSSTRVNNTFRKIIDFFWRNHCRDSPCQTSSVVFSKVNMRFFSYPLSYWQVSDCNRLEKIMFQSLFGSLLNHLYHYVNENVSVKHLSLIYITSILTTLYSLKNCSVYRRSCGIYSPISFGFFRKEFR